MTDLTKQYLNGNLQDGDEYYIENKDGEVSTMYLYNDTMHWRSFKVKKLKVLAPVPSYEEWKKAYECVVSENEEITTLKELLRECLAHLTIGKYGTSVTPINILCDEVEEVLK